MSRRGAGEEHLNVHAFDAWTSNMAYALGLFFADGCLQRAATGGSWRVSFYNTDEATVNWWHQFLGNPHKLHVHHRQQDCFSSVSVSDTLGDRLNALGAVPRKSTEPIRMPELPKAVARDFVRGFFDGDGSIGLRRNSHSKGGLNLVCTFTCNSPLFLEDLAKVLDRQNIKVSQDRVGLQITGSNAERLCQYMYSEGPAMQRKLDKWLEWQAHRKNFGGLVSTTKRGFEHKSWHVLVGTMPDTNLARQIGHTDANVRRARKLLGVPRFESCVEA